MTNAFDFSGPSVILAANPSMRASVTASRWNGGKTGTIPGLSKKADAQIMAARVLRDNASSHFNVPIEPPFSPSDKTQRILPGNVRGVR